MPSFKNPTFQDRVDQAADARRDALEQLHRRPEPDQALVAQRQQLAERRDAARAEKASAKKQAAAQAGQAQAKALAKAAAPVPTDDERKAKRDERYAARKRRR